jgi:signal transduction histidine kinase
VDGRVEEYFNRISEITQQSLREMRLLIHELRPPALEAEGLVGALQKRLDAVEGRVGIEARVFMDDFVDFPPTHEEGLYRIANEALNNALKHGHATRETVRIWTEGPEVNLEVTDNGVGFDPQRAENPGGMGLAFMAERAKKLGGMLSIHSVPGEGTVVRVSVPLARVMGKG